MRSSTGERLNVPKGISSKLPHSPFVDIHFSHLGNVERQSDLEKKNLENFGNLVNLMIIEDGARKLES